MKTHNYVKGGACEDVEEGLDPESLLLLGDVQRVAEDLESRLFMTESTCLGRLTADIEHLPVKSREHRIHNAEGTKAE